MKAAWIFPFIIAGGVLQACGNPMNAQLKASLNNSWLASLISFGVITAFFLCAFLISPTPLPTLQGISGMPWWAPIGGLVGAVAVYAGLTLVNQVGAGAYTAATVTAALLTSLVIDHFGWFRMNTHPISLWRIVGGGLLVAGVALISKF